MHAVGLLRWTTALLLVAVTLTGCSVNPVTGKEQLNLLSPQQEVALGEQNYAPSIQVQGGQYYLDPQVNTYISEVGQRLARVSDRPDLPYAFVVIDSGVPNAWALPGGKIAINRGLLAALDDEAELAAVLGHEIVHAAAAHGAVQASQGQLLQIGLEVLGQATRGSSYGGLATQVAGLSMQAWQAHYSRQDELEADRYGMRYMAKAGYDPQAAVRLQQYFVELSQQRGRSSFNDLFASHPPSTQRVQANQALAAQLPGGRTYRERFQQAIRQIKRDQDAYEAQQAAEKALQAKQFNSALTQAERSIQRQPRNAKAWQVKGLALWELGRKSEAVNAMAGAVERNPGYFEHWFWRGMMNKELGQRAEAKSDLQRSYQLLPTQQAQQALAELEN